MFSKEAARTRRGNGGTGGTPADGRPGPKGTPPRRPAGPRPRGRAAAERLQSLAGKKELPSHPSSLWSSLGLDSTSGEMRQLSLFMAFVLLKLRETHVPGVTGNPGSPSTSHLNHWAWAEFMIIKTDKKNPPQNRKKGREPPRDTPRKQRSIFTQETAHGLSGVSQNTHLSPRRGRQLNITWKGSSIFSFPP